MPDFDWKTTLQAVAPGLATAFGGPAVGLAVKILGDRLLGNPDATPEQVQTALSGGLTGDQIVALKQAEQQLAIEMERIDQAREAAGIEDSKSARQQTVALAQAGSGTAWAPVIISIIVTVGFFLCIVLLFAFEREWTERQASLLNVLLGALVLGFGQVCNYWLGSSAGSRRAGDSVRKIAEAVAPTVR